MSQDQYSADALYAIVNSGDIRLPLTHTRSLEVVAKLEGAKDWNSIAHRGDGAALKARAKTLRSEVNGRLLDSRLPEGVTADIIAAVMRSVPAEPKPKTARGRGLSPEVAAVARHSRFFSRFVPYAEKQMGVPRQEVLSTLEAALTAKSAPEILDGIAREFFASGAAHGLAKSEVNGISLFAPEEDMPELVQLIEGLPHASKLSRAVINSYFSHSHQLHLLFKATTEVRSLIEQSGWAKLTPEEEAARLNGKNPSSPDDRGMYIKDPFWDPILDEIPSSMEFRGRTLPVKMVLDDGHNPIGHEYIPDDSLWELVEAVETCRAVFAHSPSAPDSSGYSHWMNQNHGNYFRRMKGEGIPLDADECMRWDWVEDDFGRGLLLLFSDAASNGPLATEAASTKLRLAQRLASVKPLIDGSIDDYLTECTVGQLPPATVLALLEARSVLANEWLRICSKLRDAVERAFNAMIARPRVAQVDDSEDNAAAAIDDLRPTEGELAEFLGHASEATDKVVFQSICRELRKAREEDDGLSEPWKFRKQLIEEVSAAVPDEEASRRIRIGSIVITAQLVLAVHCVAQSDYVTGNGGSYDEWTVGPLKDLGAAGRTITIPIKDGTGSGVSDGDRAALASWLRVHRRKRG